MKEPAIDMPALVQRARCATQGNTQAQTAAHQIAALLSVRFGLELMGLDAGIVCCTTQKDAGDPSNRNFGLLVEDTLYDIAGNKTTRADMAAWLLYRKRPGEYDPKLVNACEVQWQDADRAYSMARSASWAQTSDYTKEENIHQMVREALAQGQAQQLDAQTNPAASQPKARL